MSDESASARVPIEVRTVAFYGDEITGALVRVSDETTIYVPIRPICEYLGLSWGSQRNRIMRDEILAEAVQGVFITNTPGTGGGTQEMICLPLDLLPGFLFGVSAARVKPDLREKITRYRRECFRVLWAAFKHEILPAAEPAPAALSGAALAYELATAVANLAREQMEAEQRLTTRIDHIARWAKHTEERITAIEVRLDPQEPISDAQAAELALAVKTVAHALETRGAPNGYQRVYGELYRRYSISSYKRLPRSRFDQALAWLRAWLGEIEGVAGNSAQ